MKVTSNGNTTEISGLDHFIAAQTFDCGQTFRFSVGDDGSVVGVAHGKLLSIVRKSDDGIVINCTGEEYETLWKHYLALDTDYAAINGIFTHGDDEVMKKAAVCGSGIRILNQDPWETLCSFIISQNNNIPRIKKIVSALSDKYGEEFSYGGNIFHSFPTAEALAEAGEEEIFALRTGFRAKYIADAAKRVASGETDLEKIAKLPTAEAAKELMKIKGVGPKVAACALLFGLGKTDAFPIDVWVKKVFAKYYPDGFDINALGVNAGIAQQYLFYYERWKGNTL